MSLAPLAPLAPGSASVVAGMVVDLDPARHLIQGALAGLPVEAVATALMALSPAFVGPWTVR